LCHFYINSSTPFFSTHKKVYNITENILHLYSTNFLHDEKREEISEGFQHFLNFLKDSKHLSRFQIGQYFGVETHELDFPELLRFKFRTGHLFLAVFIHNNLKMKRGIVKIGIGQNSDIEFSHELAKKIVRIRQDPEAELSEFYEPIRKLIENRPENRLELNMSHFVGIGQSCENGENSFSTNLSP